MRAAKFTLGAVLVLAPFAFALLRGWNADGIAAAFVVTLGLYWMIEPGVD